MIRGFVWEKVAGWQALTRSCKGPIRYNTCVDLGGVESPLDLDWRSVMWVASVSPPSPADRTFACAMSWTPLKTLKIKRGENQMKQLLAVTQFQSECRWINLLIDSNRGPPWPCINYNRSPLDCSRYANSCASLGRNKRASAVKCVLLLKSIVVGISGALVGEQQSTGIFYDRQPLKQRFSTLLIAFHRLMVGWGTAGIRLSWWF